MEKLMELDVLVEKIDGKLMILSQPDLTRALETIWDRFFGPSVNKHPLLINFPGTSQGSLCCILEAFWLSGASALSVHLVVIFASRSIGASLNTHILLASYRSR